MVAVRSGIVSSALWVVLIRLFFCVDVEFLSYLLLDYCVLVAVGEGIFSSAPLASVFYIVLVAFI